MRSIITTSIAIIISATSFAQEEKGLVIKGFVYDSENQSVPYANVNLYNRSDSSIVSGTASKEDGSFELSIPKGNYYISISFFGMNAKSIALGKSSGVIELGKQILKAEKSTNLNGVEVVADRNQMSLQIDKRVYNVGADLNNQGTNASDVLQNIPSVTLDADGNVSLRGNSAVRILVDGKLSGFASSGDALQQLQADMIDKIEVITNASARYEAQGDAGIINIILKKKSNDGFHGSASVHTGYYPDNGVSVNANYKKKKLNLYGSLDLNQRQVLGKSTTDQRLQNADTSFVYHQGYQHTRNKLFGNIRAGFDYDLDAKNTIGASLGNRTGRGNNQIDRTYDNYTIDNVFLSHDDRTEKNKEQENITEANLNYTHKFAKDDAQWKTSLRWLNDQDFEDSDFGERSSIDTTTIFSKSNVYITERSTILQSDLTLPFLDNGKFESGIRAQVRDFDSKFGYSTLEGLSWERPAAFNDRFNYNERVYAGYVMGSNTYGRLGVQAGLRAEYSEIFTKQFSQNNDNGRTYFNLFPSLALSYKQNKGLSYQLNYSRRINRPGQWDLLPFRKFGDNRQMRVGNPNLNPELTDALEAGALKNWEQGSLLSNLYYRYTKNKFERISYLGDDGVIYSQSMNIASRNAIGLELNANYSPFKWGRLSSGFNFYREAIRGAYQGQSFDLDNFSWTNRTSINITLPQRWRFQLSGNYEAPRVQPQGKSLAMRFMDFGMSKDMMKNKATLGFNVSDIFNSRKWRGYVNTPEIQTETMFQWRQRSARLTFTYRFNQSAKESQSDNLIDNSGGGGGE